MAGTSTCIGKLIDQLSRFRLIESGLISFDKYLILLKCNSHDTFITCNYYPPGNYVGARPYWNLASTIYHSFFVLHFQFPFDIDFIVSQHHSDSWLYSVFHYYIFHSLDLIAHSLVWYLYSLMICRCKLFRYFSIT